ncbi:MAG: VCBS repeat-containing protein, partial [Spartobacteria bacterium]|nr:VCBS repeat-containing protein [Spartobacteria bacterium]
MYVNGGGRLLAMGNYFYYQVDEWFAEDILGAKVLIESVTGGAQPTHPVLSAPNAPPALAGLVVSIMPNDDGASNQIDMAELDVSPWKTNIFLPGQTCPYLPMFVYTGGTTVAEGVVAMGHRAQPTLEWPGLSFAGRTIYTCFGLEGVNDSMILRSSRTNILQHLMHWLNDSPAGAVAVTQDTDEYPFTLTAGLTAGIAPATLVSCLWEFGDGSAVVTTLTAQTTHTYPSNGHFTCRVQLLNSWGNQCIAERIVNAGESTTPLDFDGDGKSDLAVYHVGVGNWYVKYSAGGSLQGANWGWQGARPATGDYDGDGINDLVVYGAVAPYEGNWYIQYSSDDSIHVHNWGWNGSTPVPGDYDGDGLNDLAVYGKTAPYEGNWYIQYSSDDSIHIQNWGWSGAMPVPGDYDGDGKDDLAVYGIVPPYEGNWYIHCSSDDSIVVANWGWNGAMPV